MRLPPDDASSQPPASSFRPIAPSSQPAFPEIDSGGSQVCRRILAVYLACYYLAYTQWVQFIWLAVALLVTAGKIDWKGMARRAIRDPFIQTACGFLGWMTLRSLLTGSEGRHPWFQEAGPWLAGALGLVAFAAVAWQAASRLRALEAVGAFVGGAALLAAITSIILFYFVLPHHGLGERLSDWFVFGGLNPVCTGLIFGFAVMWVICLKSRCQGDMGVVALTIGQILLLLAVLFTRSRGALLALVAGHAALLVGLGWRQLWREALILIAVCAAFQLSGPLLADLAWRQEQARLPPSQRTQSEASPQTSGNELMREMVDRADSGRFEIYRAGLDTLPHVKDWLFGVGQWNTDHLWLSRLEMTKFPPEHLHSAYLATLVHGGLIGLALVLALIFQGLKRAFNLARRGEFTWWVLLIYGCTGLLFDGQTFTRLNSVPLYEPLLVAFPLVVAASSWTRQNRSAAGLLLGRTLL